MGMVCIRKRTAHRAFMVATNLVCQTSIPFLLDLFRDKLLLFDIPSTHYLALAFIFLYYGN